VRADEATIRHVATLHALQSFLVGSVMALLGIYMLCVDGLQHSAKVRVKWLSTFSLNPT
jgi:uncharacterized membrane protein (Fun14 family)